MRPSDGLADSDAAKELDRALVRGLAWTGGVKWASQAVLWASTLAVARILSPEDYGLVGMATIWLGLVALLSEFGIGASIVVLRNLNAAQIAQINSLAVISGVVAAALSCAAAQPLALFFKTPELGAVVVATSSTFLLAGFRTVPQSILQRDLRFRSLAVYEGIQAIVVAAASVGLATLGFGYWTLVIGNVLSVLLSTALIIAASPQRFARPRLYTLLPALQFTGHIIVQRLAWFTYSNADFLIAGKLLGTSALGSYSFAWGLASIPVDKLSALVMQVTPTIFSSMQSDRAALRRYLLALTEGLALITFPITLGLSLVANDLVPLALGVKWNEMVMPLQLLALYASVRSITPLLATVLNVTGDAGFVGRTNMVAAVVLPLAFYVGSHWGAGGIAAAWIVAHPIVLVPLFVRVARRVDLCTADYVRALWPALSSSLAMVAAVCILKWSLSPECSLPVRFGVQVAAGAVAYAAVVLGLHRGRLHAFMAIHRSA